MTLQDFVESSRIISETASDAIITINDQSRILFVNRAAVIIFGYAIEEMLGAELTMLMPEYLRHLHRSGLSNYIKTGRKHISWEAVELPGLHKSGKEIALELSFGEFQKDGQRFFTGIARDITKRKQDEKLLAALQKVTDYSLSHLSLDQLMSESLTRLREALKVDTAAILLLRTEGDELVAWAAQGLEEEVRLGIRIPVGKGFAGKIVAEGKPIIIDDVSKADVYNPLLREKGIKSLLGVPLVAEGRPIGVLHVGTLQPANFTEEDLRLTQLAADRLSLAIENARLYQVEKNARAEAEKANRTKDEFLAILSHELRTPLTPIIGWVHMMESGILSEADFNKALGIINRNAYGLKRLINDLLDMSAILNGKMRIEEADVRVAQVLTESVESMRAYARDGGVQLKLDITPEARDTIIKGDRARLSQTFYNLLHNAIKFSPASSLVQVKCERNDSELLIAVSDQGDGIATEFLPHVFERFRQADGSRSRAYGGLGLGLALVKSFVTAHSGTIEASSDGVGKGSLFLIKFPHATISPERTAPETHDDLSAASRRLRIMIVEDQPDTLDVLTAQFTLQGYETVSCISAMEALKLSEEKRFDVLISDIAMPEIDGLELIRTLRLKPGWEKTPAIALTGYAAEKDAQAALAAGFDLHLSKPIDPAELATAVEDLLLTDRNRKPDR